jgi:ubiquinone/menaquinone biosynthesis C-methylase UbiE
MKPIRLFASLGVLLTLSCTSLKRCAYEGGNRDGWQEPDRVIAALELAPGARVADLGSGGGYFTFRLAQAVGPQGVVYAVDIDRGLLDYVSEEARRRGLGNIQAVEAAADDPRLPEQGVDLIFTSNTYHHLADRTAYFERAARYLRPGGRIAVVEYTPGTGFFSRLFGHATRPEDIQREMEAAGYRLAAQPDFLSRQSFQVFERKG